MLTTSAATEGKVALLDMSKVNLVFYGSPRLADRFSGTNALTGETTILMNWLDSMYGIRCLRHWVRLMTRRAVVPRLTVAVAGFRRLRCHGNNRGWTFGSSASPGYFETSGSPALGFAAPPAHARSDGAIQS